MTSEKMKYHIDRIERFDLARREWRARKHIRKSQRQKEDDNTFCAIGYGAIVVLILVLLVTR